MIPVSALCAGLLLFAAFTDIKWRIIPNRTVLLLALAGIMLRSGDGVQDLLGSMAIAGIIFALMLFLFNSGMVGGGDVKLLAAASLLSTPEQVGSQLVFIALAGGAIAMLFLARPLCLSIVGRGAVVGNHRPTISPAAERTELLPGFQGDGLPYGVAICIGTLVNMAFST